MKSQFSKDCRSTLAHYDNARIPKIITEEKKEMIDNKYKDSYNNVKKTQIDPPKFQSTVTNINDTTKKLTTKIIRQPGDKIQVQKNPDTGTWVDEYTLHYNHPINNTRVNIDSKNFGLTVNRNKLIVDLYNFSETLNRKYKNTILYIEPIQNIRIIKSNYDKTIKLDVNSKFKKNLYYIYYKIKISNIQNPEDTQEFIILDYDYKQNTIVINSEKNLTKNSLAGYSYIIYEDGIDCGETLKTQIDTVISDDTFDLKDRATTLKCKSLEYNVNGKKRYYVCPMVWDTYENISINPNNLTYKNDQSYQSNTNDWRTIKNDDGIKDISDLDDVHFKGTDNESHRNIYATKTNMRKNIPTQKESILLSGKRNNSYYKYPGFIRIKETNDLWPCCFTNGSERIEEWFKPSHIIKQKNLKLTKISKKDALSHGEISYIDELMLQYLYIDKDEIEEQYSLDELKNGQTHNIYNIVVNKTSKNATKRTGYLSEVIDIGGGNTKDLEKNASMIPLLVKQGIYKADNNSFLVTLLDLLPISFWENKLPKNSEGKTIITIQTQMKYLMHQIVTHLTEKEFKTLNKGSIDIMFTDTESSISSYQNFIEYILTGKDTEKKYYDFWDYVTRPHKWLFTEGLRILMLEKITSNYQTEYKLVNPYFFDTRLYNDATVPFAIIIKYNKPNGKDYFEPIHLYWSQITDSNIKNFFPELDPGTIQKGLSSFGIRELDYLRIKKFTSTNPYDIYQQMIDTQKTNMSSAKDEEAIFINDFILNDIVLDSDEEIHTIDKHSLQKYIIKNINDDKRETLKKIIIQNIKKNIKERKKEFSTSEYSKLTEHINKFYTVTSKRIQLLVERFFNIQVHAILLNIYNYFEHIQGLFDKIIRINQMGDVQYTLQKYIQEDSSHSYKTLIINQHNKVTLLQRMDNTFIPINNEQIPDTITINKVEIKRIYKQMFNLIDNHITLPDIQTQLNVLTSLHDIPITLIVDDEQEPSKIFGVINSYNTIIPIDHTQSNYDHAKHSDYVLTSYKILLADLSINEYYDRKKYIQNKPLVTFTRVYSILQNMDSIDIYYISNIYCLIQTKNKISYEYCIGVEITKKVNDIDTLQLYTNIEPILVSELPSLSLSSEYSVLLGKTVEKSIDSIIQDKIIIQDSKHFNYTTDIDEDTLLKEYNLLYKRSEFTLTVNPSRYYMCKDKNFICGVLLENKTLILFKKVDQFSIIESDNNHYHIHTINTYSFINKINFLDNMYYTNRNQLDERIRSINIIQYNEQIHTVVNISLKRFLYYDSNNLVLKDYIKNIIYSHSYNKEEKFLLIYPIIKFICEKILLVKIPYDKNNKTKINTMDIKDLDKCYNIKLKDNCNTHICSYVSPEEEQEDSSTIKSNDVMIQEFIDNINDYAIEGDSEHIDVSYFKSMYAILLPSIISVMKHLLYNAKYINCKQFVYEIYDGNDFNNLIYKFTYMLVNNYIMQQSILEGEELVKTNNHINQKENEFSFDENDITTSSINTIFQNTSKYTYDREKLIIDYILNWNHNSYISISTHTEAVTLTTLPDKVLLELDLSNMSFLGNIVKEKKENNDDTYTIIELNEEKVLLQ